MAEIPANLNPCNPQSLPPINQPVTPLCHFHMCLCGSHYFNIYTPCSYSYSFHFILTVHYHFCTCMCDGPHGLSIFIKSFTGECAVCSQHANQICMHSWITLMSCCEYNFQACPPALTTSLLICKDIDALILCIILHL